MQREADTTLGLERANVLGETEHKLKVEFRSWDAVLARDLDLQKMMNTQFKT